jgi:YD repeat-containing protein
LHRDSQRNLQEITTPHGHWIKFWYDALSRIKRAADDNGHWAEYAYDQDGMLRSVILSSGRERHYEYNGVLMTRITDEKGRVLLQNWYDDRFLIRQQFGDGAIYAYKYDWPEEQYFPREVTVILPNGTRQKVTVGNSVPDFVKNPQAH